MEQRLFITLFMTVRHLFLPRNTLINPSTDVSENPTAWLSGYRNVSWKNKKRGYLPRYKKKSTARESRKNSTRLQGVIFQKKVILNVYIITGIICIYTLQNTNIGMYECIYIH